MRKTIEKKTAIILLSGGLDSTVSLWWALKQPYIRVVCLTFLYGSKEEKVLKKVTENLSKKAAITEHKFIELDFLVEFSKRVGSSLAKGSKTPLPELMDDELDNKEIAQESAQKVWIPARNLVFLAIASSYAEVFGKEVDIITGFNLEEGATFPDNTQEFIDDFTKTASRGVLKAKINVLSPMTGKDKSEIVNLGIELEVPFDFSSSCYNPKGFDSKNRPIHCGICESCLRRKRGFKNSSRKDPTIYEK